MPRLLSNLYFEVKKYPCFIENIHLRSQGGVSALKVNATTRQDHEAARRPPLHCKAMKWVAQPALQAWACAGNVDTRRSFAQLHLEIWGGKEKFLP